MNSLAQCAQMLTYLDREIAKKQRELQRLLKRRAEVEAKANSFIPATGGV